MRLNPIGMVQAAGRYLRRHPEELVRAARNATALRLGVPLAALRYFAGQLRGAKMPRDIALEARSPGLHLAASLDLMDTPVRASATVFIEGLDVAEEHILVEARLADVKLSVLDDTCETPVAALLRSGALDLSRPGDLASYMPQRPPLLIEASKDRVVLDLMRLPQLSGSGLPAESARKLVALLLPFVSVDAVRTQGDHLDVTFKAFPRGASEALAQLRGLLQR